MLHEGTDDSTPGKGLSFSLMHRDLNYGSLSRFSQRKAPCCMMVMKRPLHRLPPMRITLRAISVIIALRKVNNLPSPLDSIREAVLTVSPNRQYRGILRPTTPATQEPEDWILTDSKPTWLFKL